MNSNNESNTEFELFVNHSFEHLSLRVKFQDGERVALYHLTHSLNLARQQTTESQNLKLSDWKSLCNVVRQARIHELPKDEPKSEWRQMDGATYTLKLEIDKKITWCSRNICFERRFCVVVNKMIELIPQLDQQAHSNRKLKDYYLLRI